MGTRITHHLRWHTAVEEEVWSWRFIHFYYYYLSVSSNQSSRLLVLYDVLLGCWEGLL